MNNKPTPKQPVNPEVVTKDEMPEIQIGVLNVGQVNFDLENLRSQIEQICDRINMTDPNKLAAVKSIKFAIPVAIVTGPPQIEEFILK